MKKSLRLTLLIIIFMGSLSVTAQKTWVGANNGTWSAGSNWSPNGVPGSSDQVTINTSVNINVDASPTISGLIISNNASVSFTSSGGNNNASRTMTINNSGSNINAGSTLELRGGSNNRAFTLAFSGSNRTFQINGTLIISNVGAGSTFTVTNSLTTVNGTLTNSGGTITSTASNLTIAAGGTYNHDRNGGPIATATWNASSTCLVTGITNTIPSAGLGQSFGNFTWNCAGQSAAMNNLTGASGGLTTINGNLTISSTNGQTLNFNNSSTNRTVTLGGDFNLNDGVVDLESGTGTTVISMTGNLTVSGTAVLDSSTTSTSTTNGTFIFNGTGTKTLNFSTLANVGYINYTVNNGVTLELLSGVTLTKSSTAAWRGAILVNSGGIINCGTQVIDGQFTGTNANFTISSGAKMITANATGVQGSVNTTNVNTTYNSGASYEFRGAATGVFTLTTANTITGVFSVNRSAGVTLSQDFTTSTLEFLNGSATTGSFAITIPLTGSITGANASRYVNGRLNKVFNSATSFTFPIGKSDVYKPLTFQYTSLTGTSTVSVEQFESALVGTLPSLSNLNNNRYWEISQSGGSSIGYKVSLDGSGDSVSGTVVMLKRESEVTTSHAVTTPNFTNATAFTTLSGNNQFTLGSICTQTALAGSNLSFCSPEAVVLNGNTPTYGAGAWTVTGPSNSSAQFSSTTNPTATFTPVGGNGQYTLTWTVTNGNCSSSADVILEYGKTTSWTSASGGSWSNGAPDATTTAIIEYNYTSTSNVSACSLTVTNNAEVVISTGDTVTLSGGLTVNTGSAFTLENDAYLMQSGTTNLNNGAITVEKLTQDLMRLDYVLWSSPVENQNLLSFSPLTVTNRFYTYNSSSDSYSTIAPGANNFSIGKGYLIRMPDNHPTSPTAWQGNFVGKPNSGDLSIALSTAGGGYNAVGNPYPSPISIEKFLDDNSSLINGDLYFWRKTNNTLGSAYVTFSGGAFSDGPHSFDNIQPGQGFFVKANNAGDLQFNNLQRELTSGVFYRNEQIAETSRIWLHLKNNNSIVGNMAIGYRADATNEIDSNLDGEYINDSSLALNSIVAQTELSVQHRAEFVSTDVVPLSFKTNIAGSFEISINAVDGLFLNEEQQIFLKDNLLNMEHDLKNGSYSFVSDAGTFANRFEIIYQSTLSVENPVLQHSVVVFSKDKTIQINSGLTTITNVKVFDLRGRLLAEQNDVNASTVSIPLTQVENQVLIVQITSTDGQTTSKKVAH